MQRLHELDILPMVDKLACVSGGSIIAALYSSMLLTPDFSFANFERRLMDALRQNCRSRWIRRRLRRAMSFLQESNSDRRVSCLEEVLEEVFSFKVKLKDLPERPQLLICATELHDGQSYVLRKEIGDFSSLPLARAVAASASIPAIFEPIVTDITCMPAAPFPWGRGSALNRVVLVDGGVTDNRALQCLPHVRSGSFLIVSDASRYILPRRSDVGVPGFFGAATRYQAIKSRVNKARADARLRLLQELGHISGYCGFTVADMPPLGRGTDCTRFFLPSRYLSWLTDESEQRGSPYEYPMRLSEFLAEIRTDLDDLSECELSSLMYQGYLNVSHALLTTGWRALPERLRKTFRRVNIERFAYEDARNVIGGPISDFYDKQTRSVAEGEIDSMDAIPRCLSWREFNVLLQERGLSMKWKSFRQLDDLHRGCGTPARIVKGAEQHLSRSRFRFFRTTLRIKDSLTSPIYALASALNRQRA
jgi:predicted acylesterase/phospholipase RssA